MLLHAFTELVTTVAPRHKDKTRVPSQNPVKDKYCNSSNEKRIIVILVQLQSKLGFTNVILGVN